jgi:predicted RNase H-like HicB family nuclease
MGNFGGVGPLIYGSIDINNPMFLEMNQFIFLEYSQQLNLTVLSLTDSIRSLEKEMEELRTEVRHLCRLRTFVVPLATLAPEPMQMRLNIPATVEGDGEDFTATFTEANVSASGETAADALANLKSSLVSTYEFLESLPETELGPLPARQWEVLRNVLTR